LLLASLFTHEPVKADLWGTQEIELAQEPILVGRRKLVMVDEDPPQRMD